MPNIKDSAKEVFKWWIRQRMKKLRKHLSDTMTINPFMTPFLFDYHNCDNVQELIELIVNSHLMVGHATGFGKLIDEKLLPRVFNTTKLDATFRNANPPYDNSAFDEVDHIITREDESIELLSLKAGKWTIQLTMAVQLNRSFKDILRYYSHISDNIVVGVLYGKTSELTDKYDILRGINRGANHHVEDIQENVSVFAGEEFWNWLGGGDDIQDQVLNGFLEALEETKLEEQNQNLLEDFSKKIGDTYQPILKKEDGTFDWLNLLHEINNEVDEEDGEEEA